MQLKKIVLSAIILGASSNNAALAGAMAGGASEVTQIANNIELIAQVSESARQTSVQMNQLYTQLQNVQSLGDLSSIESKMGLPPGSLSKAAESAGSIQKMRAAIGDIGDDSKSLSDRAKSLQAMYKAALKTYEKTGVPPTEALKQLDKLPEDQAKVYQNMAENTKDQINETVREMNQINKQAAGIGSITGNVKGLQYLAAQNGEIEKSLKQTELAIRQAQHQELEIKKMEKEEEAAKIQKQRAEQEAVLKRFEGMSVMSNEVWKDLQRDQK